MVSSLDLVSRTSAGAHPAGRQAETVYFSPVAARFMQYRLTTNIFYYQSLVLWGLVVVLTACKLQFSL